MTDCTFIGKTDEIVFCPANNLYKAVGWPHSAFRFLKLNKTKHKKTTKNHNKGAWVLGVTPLHIPCCNQYCKVSDS